jgi:hypothetical protein
VTNILDGVWAFSEADAASTAYRYVIPAPLSTTVKVANNQDTTCHDNRTMAVNFNPLAARDNDTIIDAFTSLLVCCQQSTFAWVIMFLVNSMCPT